MSPSAPNGRSFNHWRVVTVAASVGALASIGIAGTGGAYAATGSAPQSANDLAAHSAPAKHNPRGTVHGKPMTGKLHVETVCARPKSAHLAQCFAQRVVTGKVSKGVQPADSTPAGYGPADLASAYNLPSDGGGGATIAVVDAYDDPNAAADLAVYRAQYGLAPLADGQFKKVNQDGEEGNYPPPDAGWAGEISLDLDMVSAVAPDANIILVEANDTSFDSLGFSVDQAVALGATYVSNSYGTAYNSTPGSGEDPTETTAYDPYYNHPGVAVVASTGDDDYGVSYPAASQYVTSVGGTSLTQDSSPRGWTESVWNNSYGGPGSGCSLYEAKPSWQTSATQCDMRSVADVSAVADPETGVAVYDSYQASGWQQYGGTSASSPIIASTFAVGGPVPAGTYPSSFPYLTPSALNDVTTGNNGTCSPAVYCTAEPGYDGPTGLGTPNGVSAFRSGPHGEVKGTVTDARTGTALAGAKVTLGTFTTSTGADGTYDLTVEPGTYTLTVAAYGYVTKTVTGIAVADGATVSENIALTPARSVTVSGTVVDGSGHGWPLYSKITLADVPGGPVYTDPYTGHYSFKVPANATYTMTVAPVYPGYIPATKTLTLKNGNVLADVKVKADPLSGTAPGYATKSSGPTQPFDGTTTPAGWNVTDSTTGGGWVFDDPGSRGNLTGGTGGFAIVDSDHDGVGVSQDTTLTAPPATFTGGGTPIIAFDTDYKGYSGQVGDVDYSLDGGSTWTTVWEHTTDSLIGHEIVQIPAAAGKSGVLVRFHFTASFGYYWELDNVQIGSLSLTKIRGGLVDGNVLDNNTHLGLNGASVTNKATPTETAVSMPTPDDPNIADGFYWMFAKGAGTHVFTAAKAKYASASKSVTVDPDAVVAATFSLNAGQVSATPADGLSTTVKWGGQDTKTLTLKNTGKVAATVNLSEQPGGMTLLARHGAPLQQVKATTSPLRAAGSAAAKSHAKARRSTAPADDTWQTVANLPTTLQDNVSMLSEDGTLYSAFGYDGSQDTAAIYALDPDSGTWSQKTSSDTTREAPAHGYISGKWYISGGWGPDGSPLASTEAYDPGTDSWSNVANNPSPLSGSGSAVLDGKLYVVGGCDTSACGYKQVEVYDPSADSWSTAADYPELTSWLACAGINGEVYCAGGYDGSTTSTSTYAYDPGSDSWTKLADMPADIWGSAYTGANGLLLMSGGVTDQSATITNAGYAYDPTADAWTALPNANTAAYRAGGALGFYKVGGNPGGSFTPPVATVELLPGYDQGGSSDVPWLSESPTTLTLAPGASANVAVGFDASVPAVTQPGTFTAKIGVQTDTPYSVPPIPVSMSVLPPKTWGKIMGTVTTTAADGTQVPLAGATVEIDGFAADYTFRTAADGTYGLWLDQRNNPLTVIVAKDGYRPQTKKVRITKGQTITVNFNLVKP